MKLLFISYNALSDSVAQSQVIPYLEKLVKRGFDITLLSYEKLNVRVDTQFFCKMKKYLRESGIKWHHLRYHKRPSLVATFYDIGQGVIFTYYLLLKDKFNIIHARMIVPAAICLIVRKFKKFKWLFDMRGLVAEEYVGHGRWREGGIKFKLVKFVEKLCLLNADHITVLTYKQKKVTLNLLLVYKRKINIDVIPCCVDLDKFILNAPKKNVIVNQSGLDSKFILIYLGSLGTCYLLSEMIEYFLCLHKKVKNAFFLFVTNGSKELVLKKAKEKGMRREDFNIVQCPFEKVSELLSMGDAGIYFINPYKKFGSFPIKLGEYLACGLPVTSNSGIGDTADMIKRNKVGTIVDSFTHTSYQKSLDELLELSKEGDILRKRCRKTATQYLSLDKGCDGYQYIYERLSRK